MELKMKVKAQATGQSKDEWMRRSIDTSFRIVLRKSLIGVFIYNPLDWGKWSIPHASRRSLFIKTDKVQLQNAYGLKYIIGSINRRCYSPDLWLIMAEIHRHVVFAKHYFKVFFFLRQDLIPVFSYDPARARRAGIGHGIIVDKTVDTARNRVGIHMVIKPTEFNYKTCMGFECGDKSVYPGYMCPPRVRWVPKSCGYT